MLRIRSPVQFEGITYKYILTVLDVLSRYIWLRPLTGKSSKLVAEARELHKLYCEVGPPKVLQCDNGENLRKLSRILNRKLNVKITRGSPYHPLSQDKVERSHRSLRKKMMYDFVHLPKVGVNWASQLKEYQRILNEEPMDVLGNQTPFEVFLWKRI